MKNRPLEEHGKTKNALLYMDLTPIVSGDVCMKSRQYPRANRSGNIARGPLRLFKTSFKADHRSLTTTLAAYYRDPALLPSECKSHLSDFKRRYTRLRAMSCQALGWMSTFNKSPSARTRYKRSHFATANSKSE